MNKGSSLSLHRVSTVGNAQHSILGTEYPLTGTPRVPASFDMEYCTIDQSIIGAAMQLQSNVTANARYCSFSSNGTDTTHLLPNAGGRGIDVRGLNSSATFLYCNIQNNNQGGLYVTSSSNLILRNCIIIGNGTNGVKYDLQSGGEVTRNTITSNGVLGPRGPNGYNGIEFGVGWNGPAITISENTISQNGCDGIFVGNASVINIINNNFYNNWYAMTVAGGGTVNITGNMFDMPATKTAEEGIEIRNTNGLPTVMIGGTNTGESNTFRNYLDSPASIVLQEPRMSSYAQLAQTAL